MPIASELFRLDDGSEVATGLLMPNASELLLMADVPVYSSDRFMDDSELQRRLVINGQQRYIEDRKKHRKRVRNQGQLGKCNGSSNASGIEQLREGQGMPDIAISDCYIYSLANGGSDSGSALITTYQQLQENGSSPVDIQVGGVTKRLGNTWYNRRSISADVLKAADEEAKRIKGWEFFKAPMDSFENYARAIASALAAEQPVVFAWHVGGGSMRLNNGYAVIGNGRGNHSNLLHSAKWVGGKTLVHPDDQNSWGPCADERYGAVGNTGWGENGFGLFTMEDVFACASYHCTYILCSMKADPNDPAAQ